MFSDFRSNDYSILVTARRYAGDHVVVDYAASVYQYGRYPGSTPRLIFPVIATGKTEKAARRQAIKAWRARRA